MTSPATKLFLLALMEEEFRNVIVNEDANGNQLVPDSEWPQALKEQLEEIGLARHLPDSRLDMFAQALVNLKTVPTESTLKVVSKAWDLINDDGPAGC